MRKKMGFATLMLSILIGVFLIVFPPGRSHFDDNICTPSEYEKIKAERIQTDSLRFIIQFDEQTLLYSKGTNRFYYSLIEGSPTAHNPLIKLVSETDKLQICICDKGITDDVIENNQEIRFMVYTDESYAEYSLVCTTLPVMNISCSDEIGDLEITMSMYLFDNRKTSSNRVIYSDGTIRVRGSSTKVFPKKSYKRSLTKKSVGENTRSNDISLLGMRQDDDWLLYAAYNDQEKVRNVFSQNLWKYSCATDNKYAIDAGNEYKYIEVFKNGEYWGLYALGYPIDEKQLGLSKDLTKDALFKKITWDSENLIDENSQSSISGYEVKGIDATDPDDEPLGWDLLFRYYKNLHYNRKDSSKLADWFDLDNAIDTYLFMNLIQGVDNVSGGSIKNLYIALRTEDSQISSLYIPWDMDITWGNTWTDNISANYIKPYNISEDFNRIMESGYLHQTLLNEDANTWDSVFKKYWILRSTAWSQDNLDMLIDEYENDIYYSGAYLREMERWPYGTYQDPHLRLSVFREYVHKRLNAMDRYMKALEENCQKSIFIRRSLQYPYFLESDFVIEINNRSILDDKDYVALLEYLNIDISRITSDTRFVIGSPDAGYECYNTLGEAGDTLTTNIGEISLVRIDETAYAAVDGYSVFLNNTRLYDTASSTRPDIRMCLIHHEKSHGFDFTKDFVIYAYE